jgi:two-component system cell cycle sensor histidine kinase/response regulator CckA
MMEEPKTLNVAIVGGGPGCKAIMDMIFAEKLSQLRMRLVGVACTNPEAVGYQYAQGKGVYTTRDYRDLYNLKDLDMIIELTGRLEIANEISRTKPGRVQLMGHVAARLFWDVFQIEEDRIAERHLAAEALREAERRSRFILETMPSGLFTINILRRITSWNKEAEEITGLKAQEVIGRDCLEVLDCDACKQGCALFDDTVDKPIYGKECVIHVDGRSITISKNADILRDSEGQVMGGLESFVDISERKRAEEALRESGARLKLILQTIPSGLFTVDVDRNIISWNKEAQEITGLKAKDVIGKDCLEVLDCDECKQGCALFDDTVHKPIYGKECVIHVDGRSMTISKNGDILRNTRGDTIGGLESFVDITQQKKAEEALRESEARYRDLYENAPNAYCSVSATDGSILSCNRAALHLFGHDRETMMRMKVSDLFVDTVHGLTRATGVFRRLGAGESIRDVELQMKYKDGNPIWISLSAEPVRDSGDNIIIYRSMASDISGRKRLEAQFQQAQKLEAIATVAGGIAHNFNNLLMGIQGNVSLMLHQIDSTHSLYERLVSIEKQVESGADLTKHLLGYARKGKYEVKPINLNQLIMDTSDTFGTTKKEIRIHRELDKGLYTIKGDKGQIEQVLWNLYVNASDAMPGGGNLILQTVNTTHNAMKGKPYEVKPGPYILLTIRDTGIGMNEETIERIFEPFFTTKEMGRGTGLGLASAYGIIRAHDGHIEVESEKRRGTTFRIFLPASDTMVQDTIKAHEQVLEGTETVLLVDDEEPVLEVGRDLLKAMGYRVLIARDGREAVRVYRKNKRIVDIVILDIVMPTMGGGATYDLLKQINQDVKVLLSSGYSINGEATDILERGCNGFIQKPFSMKELSGAIRKVLQKE